MCGIAGAVGRDAELLARRMTRALVHRGPDDDGFMNADRISLGFRRLSIVDIAGGQQPIPNETGDVTLICNGEIYNSPELRQSLSAAGHKFRTHTDVEVILHLYEEFGRDCVRHLRGMFAFAIWDARTQSLFLARDHLGQKPLFWFQDGERFLFASEVQALLASSVPRRELDVNALWHYVSLRSLPDQYSMIRGIKKLPAATSMVLDRDGRMSLQRYWVPDFRDKLRLSEAEATDALEARLVETVRSHAMSDVPVGAFLSGGIDSTTVATMLARQTGPRIKVFSIGVPEADFDELPTAERVARAENMEFHSERVNADIAPLLPRLAHHLGEPVDPYALGLFLVSRLASRHVKVAMSGDGGDECFGGYDRYLGQRLVDFYCVLPHFFRRLVMPRLIRLIPDTFGYKSTTQKLQWLQSMAELQNGHRYAQSLGFLRFTPEERQQLFTAEAASSLDDPDSYQKVLNFYDAPNVREAVDRMLYTDLMMRIPEHNLVMSDRMSMACSLEVRSPLLDKKIVEFAASLPPKMKIRGRTLKYLLREVAKQYLPQDISQMPKQGFGFPIGAWLRGDLRRLAEQRLKRSRLVEAGTFNEASITRILHEHTSGRVDHSYRLWLLLNLEIWYELYIEGGDVETIEESVRAVAGSVTYRGPSSACLS